MSYQQPVVRLKLSRIIAPPLTECFSEIHSDRNNFAGSK